MEDVDTEFETVDEGEYEIPRESEARLEAVCKAVGDNDEL
jgi:hypothetical protein